MKSLAVGSVGLFVSLACCAVPPVYTVNGSPSPVAVDGESCSAQLYSVEYSELTALEFGQGPIERTNGTQYRVSCGAATTNCRLNQPLDACVAMIEAANRSDDDESDSGYTPPT